jgi:hypothetical protein
VVPTQHDQHGRRKERERECREFIYRAPCDAEASMKSHEWPEEKKPVG